MGDDATVRCSTPILCFVNGELGLRWDYVCRTCACRFLIHTWDMRAAAIAGAN